MNRHDLKEKSRKEFLSKISGLYNCDYSKVVYETNKIPVIIICEDHDMEYLMSPANHLKHKGCPQCRVNSYGQHLKLSSEEFLEKARTAHGDVYDYSQSVYSGYTRSMDIVCPVHGVFRQVVKNHLAGSGCPLCANTHLGPHNILTDDQKTQFFSRCKSQHSDFYSYDKSVFVRLGDSMVITCPIHGEFSQKAIHHRKGNGCQQCGLDRIGASSRMSVEQFIDRGKMSFGDRYNYAKAHQFKNNKERVIIRCNHCVRDFPQFVEVHMRGHGCPNYVVKESKWELEVIDYLKDIGVTDIEKTRSIIGNQELDIYSPSHQIAVECNGNCWHSEMAGGKQPMYHLNKTRLCNSRGIQLIHIFEDEWIGKSEIVESVLCNKFGLTKNRIHARKCVVREITTREKQRFLETNHMFGSAPSTVKLGLYHNDLLVSVMSFIRHPTFQWELNRFCNIINTNVVGGASRLFTYFDRSIKPTTVMSLADIRWSDGGLYQTLGFNLLSGNARPTYTYTRNYLVREHKMNYRRSKLPHKLVDFDASKSERENMFDNGYDRIWDCGHLTYIWNETTPPVA